MTVRSFLRLLISLLCLAAASVDAAHTQASLILSHETARSGETIWAGIHLRMEPEWHTYWKNSGASGLPTKLNWDLPAGISAGNIVWPRPDKLPPEDLTTYVYQNEVVLLVPLKLAADLSPGPRELRVQVSWLECKEQCIPGQAGLSARLNIGSETKPSTNAALIEAWREKLPQPGDNLSVRAWWEKGPKENVRPLIVEWASPTPASEADLYPYGGDDFEVQGRTERLPADSGKVRLRKPVKIFQGDWPKQFLGVLIQKTGDQQLAYEVTLPIGVPALSQPLWRILIYAFLGGLILNVMPCVLPVIALKILGFVGEARNDPGRVRRLGLIYALGVLVSFLALAGVVIGVRAAGHQAGWGMQFASPQFIVVLTVLVTLVALNLFGLFEINLGSRTMSAAGALASRHGASGAFFNGVLATVLATPCTAPYLGAALGFAFAPGVSYAVLTLIFLTVGAGLAAPYVLLSWQPAWLKFLPKPGAWMEKFKIAMGFPMLATAIWLLSLAGIYYGKRAWWLGIFLLIVAMAAWVYGQFIQRGQVRRGLALLIMALLLIGGYAFALEGQLNWREPLMDSSSTAALQESPEGIEWQRWSPRAVAHAQGEGQPVLVDFTADWCLTCQANKRIALEVSSVRAKLKEIGAVAFLGDYTRFPPDITEELNRYGRAGVPLVMVYPGQSGAPPQVLPELLTSGIVLDALDRAAK